MNRREEYERLVTEMYAIYVESSLASPLCGSAMVEINPRKTVREIVHDFIDALQSKGSIQGLAVFDKSNNKLEWDVAIESQGIEEGSKVYIRYDKTSFLRPVHIAVAGITTVFIGIVLLTVASVLFGTTGGIIPFDYGIVIDAGSTHTEVFLYQWSGSKDHGTGDVSQKDSCKYNAGIASGFDPSIIVSCVNKVANIVPKESPAPILYLGATGGMRLLNMSNPKDAKLILIAFRYALSTSAAQVKSVDIIQGEDEAVCSWITTNFLKRTLSQEKVQSTFGALDLGGASTQYAYALNRENTANFSDIKVLKLYGHKYSVASNSYLCFGWQQAIRRNYALILMAKKNTTVVDPCYPKGFVLKIEAKQFIQNPCLFNKNFTNWIRAEPDMDNLVIYGSSNYKECKRNVINLVDENACKNMGFQQCLEKHNLGELNETFMAFSTFYYIVTFLDCPVS